MWLPVEPVAWEKVEYADARAFAPSAVMSVSLWLRGEMPAEPGGARPPAAAIAPGLALPDLDDDQG